MRSVFAIAVRDEYKGLRIYFVQATSELDAAKRWSNDEIQAIRSEELKPEHFDDLQAIQKYYVERGFELCVAEVPNHAS